MPIQSIPAVQRLILLVFSLLILLQGFEFGMTNTWSLRYLHHVTSSSPVEQQLLPPPSNHQRAPLWLARAALLRGDLTRAETLLTPLATAGDALAISALGEVLLAQGDFQGAIQKWDEIENSARIAQVARQTAVSGQLDNALLAYEANLRFNPERGVIQLVNFLWETMDDHPAAEAVLRQALVDYPESRYHVQWLHRMAIFMDREERWDESERLYQLILEERPDNSDIWISLGWTLYRRGDGTEAAQAAFERAITIDPERSKGYVAMGRMLAQSGRYAEADNWYEQAIAHDPENQGLYLTRADTQLSGGNLPLALELYQQAIARFPGYAQAYYQQAWAYYRNEQPQEAAVAIERALQLFEELNQQHYVRAGTIFEWAGDVETAVGYYKLALALNPDNDAAARGLQRLEMNP